MEFRPLTARSVVLSTLLGSHPPRLPARYLVRVGELFGVAEGTIRVALSRMVAAGDLVQTSRGYALSDRLVHRQNRQDESRAPHTRPWSGAWELVVVTADRRAAADRAALRQAMADLRLAELREGTWLRPANLDRPRPGVVTEQCAWFEARPDGDPAELAARLWDLDAWSARAGDLSRALDPGASLADRFVVSAAVLRHLLQDPLLPDPLLPGDWPGGTLRAQYAAFQADFEHFLVRHVLEPG
ncbi:PaaX family transcriptional regulator C-terminal domain-containing protein [Actinocorallia longicatena]|uniref:PaaX family transcriptional regulator C-terminal domain-containing protein n=1 Tax=Actinocorallia longicatena TaxID=111803 RepID=A0ABP6QIL2_9ACTN